MTEPNVTGNDTPNPNPGDSANTNTDSKPDFATKDELAAMANAAVTSQLKRSMPKAITDALAQALGPALDAALAPIKEKLNKPPPEPERDGKGKQDDPQVVALKKQLDDVTAAMRAAQEESTVEKRKAKEQEARTALRAELAGKVRPEALEDVVDLLFYRKKIAFDDQGALTFTWRSALSKGMPEEDHAFPLVDGVREFLKSKPAEIYLPPPSAGGGGKGGKLPAGSTLPGTNRYDKPAQTDDEKLRRADEITRNLQARGIGIENV